MPEPASDITSPVAVLDMGATAVRVVIAEVTPSGTVSVLEEASRAVMLGRDTFSAGAISSATAERVVEAVNRFRELMAGYNATAVRAVATSAVREARNRDVFLDRLHAGTGIAFEVINEAEESRLLFLAQRQALRRHAAFKGAWTLLVKFDAGPPTGTPPPQA